MNYFKLDSDIDIKVIGAYPQIQKFKTGYDSSRPESCSRIGRYISETPVIPFDFDGPALENKAKLTDYISASYLSDLTGLLISNRLHEFITKQRIVDYIEYPVKIYRENKPIPGSYSWLHYNKSYPEFIDFSKSQFYFDHPESGFKEISIKSYEVYLQEKARSNYIIESKRLGLKKALVNEFDIIRIGVIKGATYVKEDVKIKMHAEGFTGITFEPVSYLIQD